MPECSRCVKYGLLCPGYPQECDARFRHETSKTVHRWCLQQVDRSAPSLLQERSLLAFDPRSQDFPGQSEFETSSDILRTSNREGEAPSSARRIHDQSITTQSASLIQWITSSKSLACTLNLPGETILTCYFFDQVLMPSGWHSYLPQLYSRSPQTGCLRLTVAAASLYLAANQTKDDSLALQAGSIYDSVLQTTNAAIDHSQQRLQDETLCSVLILNILDSITGQSSFAAGTHLAGCAQLLKLREDQGFWTSCTPDLAYSIFIQTQAQVVKNYQPYYESSREWLCTQTVEKPAATIYNWCLDVGRFSKAASSLLSSFSHAQSNLEAAFLAVIQEAHELDSLVVDWHVSGGSRWDYRTTSLASSSGQQTTADYYSDVSIAKVWNQYRSARILLHEIIVKVTQQLQESGSTRERDSLAAIRYDSLLIVESMLTGICNSIPFNLQKIDPMGRQCSSQSQRVLGGCALIWPLETVLRCRLSHADHWNRASQAFNEIGHIVGIRQALVSLAQVAENDTTFGRG